MSTPAAQSVPVMPGQFVFRRIHALQWTGSNGAEVADFYTSLDADRGVYTVIEESADRLVLQSTLDGVIFGRRTVFPDRPWVVMDQTSGVIATLTTASYEARFVRAPDAVPLLGIESTPYFGSGLGTAASTVGIGATVNVDVQVFPSVPTTKLTGLVPVARILGTSGINIGTVTVTATPTVLTPLVPMSLANGVITPAHTVIRVKVKNSGLSVLSNVQVSVVVSA